MIITTKVDKRYECGTRKRTKATKKLSRENTQMIFARVNVPSDD